MIETCDVCGERILGEEQRAVTPCGVVVHVGNYQEGVADCQELHVSMCDQFGCDNLDDYSDPVFYPIFKWFSMDVNQQISPDDKGGGAKVPLFEVSLYYDDTGIPCIGIYSEDVEPIGESQAFRVYLDRKYVGTYTIGGKKED